MGGISGIWNRDGRPLDPALLWSLGARLRHRGLSGKTSWIADGVGLVQHSWLPTAGDDVAIGPPAAPGIASVWDGRLDNAGDLIRELGLPQGAGPAACIRAAYSRWGDRFVERLVGDFALALFDRPAMRLLLARDGVGLRPLYYHESDRLFAFASEIKPLLAHPQVPTAICEEGLADFLLLGSRPVDAQDVTCFDGIRAVVPAHLLVVTPDRVVARRYWDFDGEHALRFGSFEEYAEAFRERFARAVSRRLDPARRVAVSVSGGFDSSSIFCQAERMQRLGTSPARPVLGISYEGPAGSDADERRFLREIEREYGVAIDRFPMQPLQGLVTRATEQIQTIEAPFMDYMWGVTSELHRRASAGGAGVLLTGHWGDQVLFSSAYLVDLFGRLRWRRLARHLREYGRWLGPAETRVLAQRFVFNVGRRYVPPALVPLLKRLRYRLARRRVPMTSLFDEGFLRRSLDFAQQPVGLTKAFHTAHARSIYVEARSKYHVHCLEWNNKVGAHWGMDCAFPFLDRDLLQFLMAVPGDVQNRGGVPRALAREAMTGVLPDAIRQRSWKADFSTVVNEGVVSDVPVLRRHLHRGSQAVALGLIDPGRLAARLDDVGARGGRDCVASWELADVFGLEMWLQVFFARTAREAVESPA